jgi:hypothetical protein
VTNTDRITTTEILRLKTALAAARLQSANRLAAIRAALAADADGESDPLDYLRDQLADETLIPGSGSGD